MSSMNRRNFLKNSALTGAVFGLTAPFALSRIPTTDASTKADANDTYGKFWTDHCLRRTSSDLTYYVDPVNGDDSNDGHSGGSPFETLQYALNQIPFLIKNHNIVIDLATAPKLPVIYDEDAIAGPWHAGGTGAHQAGNQGQVEIVGDPEKPGNVKLGSFVAYGCFGPKSPVLKGVEMQRAAPDDENERFAVQFHTCWEGGVEDITFAKGVLRGVEAYTSILDIRRVDVTNLEDIGFSTKRHGQIQVRETKGKFNALKKSRSHAAGVYGGYLHSASENGRIVVAKDRSTVGGESLGRYFAKGGSEIINVDESMRYSPDMRPLATAHASSLQKINNSTTSLIKFDKVFGDPLKSFDKTNNKFVISKEAEGGYKVSCRLTFTSSSQGEAVLMLKDSNGGSLVETYYQQHSDQKTTTTIEAHLFLSEGEELYVEVFNNTGSTMILEAGRRFNEFTIERAL